jgi:hypothetical protein
MPEQRKIFAVPRAVRILAFKTTLQLGLQRADTTRAQNDVFVFEYWFKTGSSASGCVAGGIAPVA